MPEAKFTAHCPYCRKALSAASELLGRQVRCTGCRKVFVLSPAVPREGESSASAAGFQNPAEAMTTAGENNETRQRAGGHVRTAAAGDSPGDPRASDDRKEQASRLGRFGLGAVLGRGGFGVVYRATDTLLERTVALKLPRTATTEGKRAQRFLNEAKAAARLRHPNIVSVLESGDIDGRLYQVSEFIEGQTLADRLKRQKPDWALAVRWVVELAQALAYAHAQGVIHRDIKPQNIMLDRHERPQIMDFGLAKRLDQDSALTAEGSVLGTPAYMSPEQARGDIGAVGPASDQYSLGVVLYELLTGKPPFDGAPAVVIGKVATQEPPRPRQVHATIPRDLEAICLKAMEKDQARRYDSLEDFAADLTRWQLGESTLARPLPPWHRLARWARRAPAEAALVAVFSLLFVAAAVGGIVAVILTRNLRDQRRLAMAAAIESHMDVVAGARHQDQMQQQFEDARTRGQTAEREKTSALADLSVVQQQIQETEAIVRETTALLHEKTRARSRTEEEIELERRRLEAEHQRAAKHEHDAYLESLAQTVRAIAAGDSSRAAEHLRKCPEPLRGWEWRHLAARLQGQGLVLLTPPAALTDLKDELKPTIQSVAPAAQLIHVAFHHPKSPLNHEPKAQRLFRIDELKGEIAALNPVPQLSGGRFPRVVALGEDGSFLLGIDSRVNDRILFWRRALKDGKPVGSHWTAIQRNEFDPERIRRDADMKKSPGKSYQHLVDEWNHLPESSESRVDDRHSGFVDFGNSESRITTTGSARQARVATMRLAAGAEMSDVRCVEIYSPDASQRLVAFPCETLHLASPHSPARLFWNAAGDTLFVCLITVNPDRPDKSQLTVLVFSAD